MQDFLDGMRREAERVLARVANPRLATVSSYDPDAYAVKVLLQPEGTETGWCPVVSQQVGNGWGLFAPPTPGDQVVVVFEDGSAGNPIVIGSVYSDEDRPVVQQDIGNGCPAGEKWLVSQSGARVRLLKDGTVEIWIKDGTQIKANADGSVDINGADLRFGALAAAFRKLVDERFVALFNGHQHPDAQGGLTGPPTQQMIVGQHTTTTTRAE